MIPWTCCGQTHQTPYCPDCGHKVGAGLNGLLLHLKDVVNRKRQDLVNQKHRCEQDPCASSYYVDRAEENLTKWEDWLVSLETLILESHNEA